MLALFLTKRGAFNEVLEQWEMQYFCFMSKHKYNKCGSVSNISLT